MALARGQWRFLAFWYLYKNFPSKTPQMAIAPIMRSVVKKTHPIVPIHSIMQHFLSLFF
jgi:hypothetical protein